MSARVASANRRSRTSTAARSHREAYARALEKATPTPDGDGPKLWRAARENANLFKSALTLGDGACKCRRGATGCPVHGAGTNPFATPAQLKEVSTKILALVEKIDANAGHKHFVFTRYSNTARAIVCALTQREDSPLELVELRGPPSDASPGDRKDWGEKNAQELADAQEQGKRKPGLMTLFPPAGRSNDTGAARIRRNNVLALWKARPYNVRGQAIHVLVGSGGDLQGVDLADTRFVHQMEALASEAAERQLDGRAVRARSMCGYPATSDEQKVIKFRYLYREGSDTQTQPASDTEQREKNVSEAISLYDSDRALRQSMHVIIRAATKKAEAAKKQGQSPRTAIIDSLRELSALVDQRKVLAAKAGILSATLGKSQGGHVLPATLLKHLETDAPGTIKATTSARRTKKPARTDIQTGPLASIEDKVLLEAAKRGAPLDSIISLLKDVSYDRLSLAAV